MQAKIDGLEKSGNEFAGRGTDEQRVGLGERLDPGRDVRRIAQREPFGSRRAPGVADQRQARVNRDQE